MDVIKRIQQFIKYMYLRYLLVTELYMVDTWEKTIVNLLIAVLFAGVWYFNYALVLNGLNQLKLRTWPEKSVMPV